MADSRGQRIRFPLIAGALQIVFIVLFAVFAEYDDSLKPGGKDDSSNNQYAAFQDVNVMIFIGFGYLMVFLKRYGYSAVGFNFLVAALSLQWATIVRGFLHLNHSDKFSVNLGEMLSADFATATVLISFGACLGKTSPLQLLVMAMIEIVLAQVNEMIGFTKFYVSDAGESMFVHIFGAYFGLAVARVLYRDDVNEGDGGGSVYHSDVFTMIGTIFLWMFWPSFNGGALIGVEQNRAFANTFFSLAACSVVSFVVSWLVNSKFNMTQIQNATLAGGVAVGTAADLLVNPYGALLIGTVAGIISVLGYQYLTPALAKGKFHDTCGVNNLHGMPGILAAIVGAIMAYLASPQDYGITLFDKFPARLPNSTSGAYYNETKQEMMDGHFSVDGLDKMIHDDPGSDRSAAEQAAWQIAACVLTLAFAIVGGIITGFILRIPVLMDAPAKNKFFEDSEYWQITDLPSYHAHQAHDSSEEEEDNETHTDRDLLTPPSIQ